MSERTRRWLFGFVMGLMGLGIAHFNDRGKFEKGRIAGRAEMKVWQDDYYHGEMEQEYQSEHPVKEESLREKCHDLGGLMTDDGHCNFVDSVVPFNQWIEPKNVTLDTYVQGGPVRVLLSKDGNTLYIQGQGIQKAPTPKPSKVRKPRSDEDYLRGYRDATNYCVASIKKRFLPAPMPYSDSWVCAGDVATCQKLAEAPKPPLAVAEPKDACDPSNLQVFCGPVVQLCYDRDKQQYKICERDTF